MEAIKNENKVFDEVLGLHDVSRWDEESLPDFGSYFNFINEIVKDHKVYGELENVAFNAAIFLIALELSRGENYGSPKFDLSRNLGNSNMEDIVFLYHYLFGISNWAPKLYTKDYDGVYYYYNIDLPHEIILASTVENIIIKTITLIANHQLEIVKMLLKANIMHPLWYTIARANGTESFEEERNRIESILF